MAICHADFFCLLISAKEALQRLISGNQRFVQNVPQVDAVANQSRREELISGQAPFAVIFGCSDSRVPAELVFDQGFGDLFVVRVAGNVVAPTQIGSVEFAVQQFGTPLVVVLGHTKCGAVVATLNELESPSEAGSPNITSLVESIKPAVMPVLETLKDDKAALVTQAVRANIRLSAKQLRQDSKVLEQLVQDNKVKIVSAEYSLETGVVEFFDSDD